MPHIFISYSRKDFGFAEKIVDAMATNNLDTWIDWKSIPKGEDWEQEIYRGIEEADAFLFLISRDSVRSNMCNKEIAHAVKNGKRIIPIVIRSTRLPIPPAISKPNWIFCRDGQDDFNKAIEETQKIIHTDYEWLKYHTKLQLKALDWERKKDGSRLLRGKELREAKELLAKIQIIDDPQPTNIQKEYILSSSRREKRVRTVSIVGFILAIVIIFISALTASFYKDQTKQQSEIAERQQRLARGRELAAQSDGLLERFPDRSILLAIEAVRLGLDANEPVAPEAARALRNNIGDLGIKVLNKGTTSNDAGNNPVAKILSEHTSFISDVEFSPDGKWLASSDGNGVIFLWNIDSSGNPVNNTKFTLVVDNNKNLIRKLVFSPDSKWLAAASDFGVYLLELTPSNPIFLKMSDIGDSRFVTFSQDSHLLISGVSDTVLLWDLTKPSSSLVDLPIPNGESVLTLVVSPDNKWLAVGTSGSSAITPSIEGSIYLWQLSNLRDNPTVLQVPNGRIQSLAFSPDGKWLASASFEVRLWNMNTKGRTYVTLTKQPTIAYKLLFSPDGRWLTAAFVYHNSFMLWDMNSDNFVVTNLIGHSNDVFDVAYSSDSHILASASLDNDIRIWNLLDPAKNSLALKGNEFDVLSVAFSPNRYSLATGGDDAKLRFWSLDPYTIFDQEGTTISSMAICPVSSRIAASYLYQGVKIWDLEDKTEKTDLLNTSTNQMAFISFSPQCNWLAGRSKTGGIFIWNLLDLSKPLISIESNLAPVPYFAFSPDEKYIATAQANGNINLWTLGNMNSPAFSIGHDNANISNIIFSGDGRWLIWSETSGEQVVEHVVLYAWDSSSATSSPINLHTFDLPQKILANKDGQLIATLSYTEVGVWQLEQSSEYLTGYTIYGPFNHMTNPLTSFAFSPNGNYLAVGTDNGLVNVTNLFTYLTSKLTGHTSIIYSIAFSHDNKLLATGSGDNTVRLWNLDTKNYDVLVGNTEAILDVGFTVNDRWLVTRSRNSRLVLWVTDIKEIANIACNKVGRNLTAEEWSQYFPGEIYHPTCSNLPSLVNLEELETNKKVFSDMNSDFSRTILLIFLVSVLLVLLLLITLFFILRKFVRFIYARYQDKNAKKRLMRK